MSVAGPPGPITMADRPSSSTTYWVARRKAEVLAAIDGRLLGLEDTCQRDRLSNEKLDGWQRTLDRAGIPGLQFMKMRQYQRP